MSTYTTNNTWISVTEATKILGISNQTIYNQIKEAINFPKQTKFKRGVCWRRVSTKKLQIHLAEWERVLNNF
jgi:predicted DNA-binding transcriptional regulator AlpA